MASQALPRRTPAKPQRSNPAKLGAGKLKGQEQRQQINQTQQRASGSGTSTLPSEDDNVSPSLGGITGTAEKASGSLPGGKTWNAMNDLRGGAHRFKEKIKSYGADAKPQELTGNAPGDLPMSLSALEGLEVGEGGQIMAPDGQPIGKVVEGDPEDLVGMTVGANGEILDEEGDLVGRVDIIEGLEKPDQLVSDEAAEGTADIGRGEALPADDEDQGGEGGVQLADAVGKTLPTSIPTSIPDVAILEGRRVNKRGKILDDEGDVVGQIVAGQDPKDLAGKCVNRDGKILDADGNTIVGEVEIVKGEAADEAIKAIRQKQGEEGESTQPVPDVSALKDKAKGTADETAAQGEGALDEVQATATEQLPDISTLEGLKCNKFGSIVNAEGVPVGELVEGDPKALCRDNLQLDEKGQFWDSRGNIIGKAQPLPVEEEPPGPFADFDDVFVTEGGWVQDANGRRVGKVIDGDAKKLVGRPVDDDGDILDKRGNIIGHAEPYQEPEPEKVDLSVLEGFKPNKYGNIMGSAGVPIARVVNGDLKAVTGRAIDREGNIWGDSGEVIGRAELIPEHQRESRGPFSGLGDLAVNGEGFVEDADGVVVGRIIEGDPKTLRGQRVDKDGDVVDEYGASNGRAERYEPPEEIVAEEDLSSLEGKTVNKLGNIVGTDGVVLGRVASGYIKHLAGKKVDGKGQIWGDNGKIMGQAELIPADEQERPEGPFFGLEGLTLKKDGTVVDPENSIVGRLVEGDPQRLAGRAVDEDGEVVNRAGTVIGRAERWTPEEKLRNINPMSGRKVTREGEVRDEEGNLLGKLTEGNLATLVGKEIDDNGFVVDDQGRKLGECTLIENLPDEPTLSPEELEKQETEKKDKELAKNMCAILQQTLESVQPLCKQITQNIEKANQTPKEELDEEQLVKTVKPLIEEAGSLLQECKGALRALDPDGSIAATAKAREASHEATPEQYSLANLLKELTQTVVETIEAGRRLIEDMPHAKKQLNPLWALLSEPLFQIIAAVGLLLSGVLGLVSNLLDGLGLGGIIRGLLGGLGIDKLLEGFGLGTVTDALGLGSKK
ncbi:hypothetical protein BBP40_002306 [Aspergillus hancockii]|nr:hypothetical protein BBP40_002306 [Aspergillus hancockii]